MGEININMKIDPIKKKQDEKLETIIDQTDYNKVWNTYCSEYGDKSLPDILPAVERIIVIGDIHGDFKMLKDSLKLAKLIDDNDNWIGKGTIVVQVGDQIDRCRYKNKPCNQKGATVDDEGNDWAILQYMTELHNKAKKDKEQGAVYSLIGNHELMNVDGDFRYVSYEGIQEFNKEKEKYINNEKFKKYYKKINPDKKIEDATDNDIRRWMFSPSNPISNFLACTRKVAIIIGSNIFVHGGILPHIAKKYKIESINKILTLYLLDHISKSDYKDILGSDNKTPLWSRAFSKAINKDKCDDLLEPLKEWYKVDNIYVGHTPMMTKGITNLCDGRVWLTDYGASTAFNPFDETNRYKRIKDLHFDNRSSIRKVQVLEILNDNKIRVIKS